jgi:hypothetical protein
MITKRTLRFLALATSAAFLVAACGGAASPSAAPTQAPASATIAPTPTPSPTPEPTPSPTPEPTPSPTPVSTGFAFAPDDVIAYYQGIGFECTDPAVAAAGFTVQQCLKTAKKAPTSMISIGWSDEDQLIHYGYGGYYNADGAKKPDKADAFQHLDGLIGALLGEADGVPVGQWVIANFGDDVGNVYNGLDVYTYTLAENPGSGYFIEIATQDFLDAIRGG